MSDQEQGALAALMAEALAPRARMPDWLPAFDDGLVQRLTHCTVCHGQPVARWGICETAAGAFAYVLCARCARTDGLRQVERLLVRRYLATLGQGCGQRRIEPRGGNDAA